MYRKGNTAFVGGVVTSISDGVGNAAGRLKRVNCVGYNVGKKMFITYTLNFWVERKVYGKPRNLVSTLEKLKVKAGSQILVKGEPLTGNETVINVDEVGYMGTSFILPDKQRVILCRVAGIYQTKRDDMLRICVYINGKSYKEKVPLWLTAINRKYMQFNDCMKNAIEKHVSKDDIVMLVTSDITVSENSNGGKYLDAFINRFFVVKDASLKES